MRHRRHTYHQWAVISSRRRPTTLRRAQTTMALCPRPRLFHIDLTVLRTVLTTIWSAYLLSCSRERLYVRGAAAL